MLKAIINAILSLVSEREDANLEAALDKQATGQNLDWRNSIVDLMKLTDQDSSLKARKELALELGYSGELNGSAEMNIWLHARVMERLRASL
jgi:hypothetical protein